MSKIKYEVKNHAGNDNLASYETISEFADETAASLTIMEDGEHWFHTKEQLAFLDDWLRSKIIYA